MSDANRRRRLLLLVRILPTVLLLALALLAVEIFARWKYGRPSMHFGLEMWKYAKTLKVRAENAEMSHRHRPNSEAFLMGVDVKINSLGLRDREITVKKPPDTCRVVVLGDSTTLGWGVPYDQLYCKIVEKELNAHPPSPRWRHYEVVNTGIGNYNTAQELASFKERWLALNPDLVWIGWYINDAEPTPKPSNNWLAYHSYGYIWLTSNFDAFERNLGVNQTYREYYRGLYADNQPGWKKCQDSFAELAAICRDHKLPLHILLIPELHTLSGNYEFKDIDDKIRAVGAKLGVSVLDLIEAFPADGDPLQYWASPEDDHPNGKANELMAAKIIATLRADEWFK
jgi:lysophospholipase L1-like esterase